uniref:Uncharacterized protein n=1 Tax=Picea glauca TaxID=3330 RepID=A0A101LXU8_PICGL|nr:hypothetical protein ABT39_MTgene6179 [Picea glauca]KUM47733.1 hypothetical protein ABT39_MTgene5920 [Picea glauca]QHR88691.1 hypothetical protein Q903MT_gene2705 [Picea sitchensis]
MTPKKRASGGSSLWYENEVEDTLIASTRSRRWLLGLTVRQSFFRGRQVSSDSCESQFIGGASDYVSVFFVLAMPRSMMETGNT